MKPVNKQPDPLVPIDRRKLDLAVSEVARRGVTVSELARRSGLSQRTVHHVIKGTTARCRASVRAKLARALGIAEDWLSGEMPYPRQQSWRRWSPEIRDMWKRIWTAQESKSEHLRSVAYHVKPQHVLVVEWLLDLYDFALRAERGEATPEEFGRVLGVKNPTDNDKLWRRRLWRAIAHIEGHLFFGASPEMFDELGVPHPTDMEY